ncbi:hypothetical protein COCNU_06G000490 [Cocos nucifera]|uniref:Uncharacterized protein n=1 Tax=Cocos nucifera TaxID=13894 RepID=A0A8K0IAA5_COCNU|nr:hypothetical protein COCNU_06G000490 [Cocos nucifera]
METETSASWGPRPSVRSTILKAVKLGWFTLLGWDPYFQPKFVVARAFNPQDFIFNNGGLSVAFIFVTNWDCDNRSAVFNRAEKLKRQFRHLYVVVSVPTREQNDSFNHSYFKYAVELGSPTFVPVRDLEMGFEKIVKIAHARGVCKRQDAISTMKNELAQAIGSIEAISKASKGFIVENTDLSVDRAERIVRRPPSVIGNVTRSVLRINIGSHHGLLIALPAATAQSKTVEFIVNFVKVYLFSPQFVLSKIVERTN